MKSENLTNAEIRAEGWQALVDRLGLTGALRFVMQTERGRGDYSRGRHKALGDLSVDQLLRHMRSTRSRGGRRRSSS